MGLGIDLWSSANWTEVRRAHALKNKFSKTKDFREKNAEWVDKFGNGYSLCLKTAIFAHDTDPLEDPYLIRTFNQILTVFCEQNKLSVIRSPGSEFLEIDANSAANRLGFLWKPEYDEASPHSWLKTFWLPALNDIRVKTSGKAICGPFYGEWGFIGINGIGPLENMLPALKSMDSEQLEINGPEIQEMVNMLSIIIDDKKNIANYKLRWHDAQ